MNVEVGRESFKKHGRIYIAPFFPTIRHLDRVFCAKTRQNKVTGCRQTRFREGKLKDARAHRDSIVDPATGDI